MACTSCNNDNCSCTEQVTIPSGSDGDDGLFGGFSQKFTFSTSTASNPSANTIRLNNATPASVTTIYVSDTNSDGVDVDAYLDSFSNSSSYGLIKLFSEYDSTKFWMGTITGVTDNGTYHTLTVTHIISNSTFSNTSKVVVSFTPKGATGATGAAGSAGATGATGGTGATGPAGTNAAADVDNVVYVMKNGNDSTGLVERFDKPFLTIAAATTAALAAFPSRTQNSRVLIKVETGYYTDTIVLYDFIDYDLGDSVIVGSVGNSTITDAGGTFTTTTNNVPNAIIYGNATLLGTQAGIATVHIYALNTKFILRCNTIKSDLRKAILMRTGYLKVYADHIYMAATADATNETISLATNNAYGDAPVIEIYNAKIYTNSAGSINSVIDFYNGETPNHNTGYCKCTLVNCEVGSWSTTRPAINCTPGGAVTSLGLGELTLKNTIIYTDSQPSIGDEYASHTSNVLKVYNYNSYANRAVSLGNASSVQYVGNILVDSNVRFNNGVAI